MTSPVTLETQPYTWLQGGFGYHTQVSPSAHKHPQQVCMFLY